VIEAVCAPSHPDLCEALLNEPFACVLHYAIANWQAECFALFILEVVRACVSLASGPPLLTNSLLLFSCQTPLDRLDASPPAMECGSAYVDGLARLHGLYSGMRTSRPTSAPKPKAPAVPAQHSERPFVLCSLLGVRFRTLVTHKATEAVLLASPYHLSIKGRCKKTAMYCRAGGIISFVGLLRVESVTRTSE